MFFYNTDKSVIYFTMMMTLAFAVISPVQAQYYIKNNKSSTANDQQEKSIFLKINRNQIPRFTRRPFIKIRLSHRKTMMRHLIKTRL